MATKSTQSAKNVKSQQLSGNAPKAADFSDQQSAVKNNSDANLNPAQPSLNQTMPYGGADSTPNDNSKQAGNTESAREFAERGVVERNGIGIKQNPQFDSLVKEEMRQIKENRKATEGM